MNQHASANREACHGAIERIKIDPIPYWEDSPQLATGRREGFNPLEKQIVNHEGLKTKVYKCPAGRLTIGVGRNIEDKGITEEEALYLLRNDKTECEQDLSLIFDDYSELSENRQRVLIDMRFNLGPGRFRQFQRMISAVRYKDYHRAAEEMENSNWYSQVGQRARNLVTMMREG